MRAMTEPRWLTPAQLAAWVRFVAVVELLPSVLDSQLQRDAHLTHFEYFVLAMLSEAPERRMRMTALASLTNATLPRLSHVVSRLEGRAFVARTPSSDDRRGTEVSLTEEGWDKVVATAPGHVATVREHVIDLLDDRDVADLERIATKMLIRLDPDERVGSRTP
jgi:DNA-binding MarR family transcriptional regulator